jgi:hypothetical protein
MQTFTATNAGTVYRLHRAIDGKTPQRRFFMLEVGWGSGYGEWIMLDIETIAWSYLVEKMPRLREGDKPGWKLVLAQAGIEVFG